MHTYTDTNRYWLWWWQKYWSRVRLHSLYAKLVYVCLCACVFARYMEPTFCACISCITYVRKFVYVQYFMVERCICMILLHVELVCWKGNVFGCRDIFREHFPGAFVRDFCQGFGLYPAVQWIVRKCNLNSYCQEVYFVCMFEVITGNYWWWKFFHRYCARVKIE